MKFNDKELAIWAVQFSPDKEGMLEKKGAGRGQGYKQRWFRLRGNLLFYFKVDDFGGWDTTGEPLGMVLLERCIVEELQHDTRPYCFILSFENDDCRSYYFSAFSQVEMESWITAIKRASYEALRAKLYKLQKKLISITGQDPLKDKGVSPAAEPSPKPRARFGQSLNRSVYLRASSLERQRRINSLTVAPNLAGPQFELSLSCSKLAVGSDGKSPCTLVRALCYQHTEDSDPVTTLTPTEVVESSTSPSYSRLLLLEIGPSCPNTGHLRFEVFSINQAQLKSEDGGAVESFTDERRIEETGTCIGRAECPVSAVVDSANAKEIKVPLSKGRLVCGFLHIVPTRLEETLTGSPQSPRRKAMSPLDRGSPIGILPTIMRNPVRCHFSFTASDGLKMKTFEEMAECVFNTQVPMALLRCYIREDNTHLEELYSIGALEDSWLESLQSYQAMLFESIATYKFALREMESITDTCGFKPSVQKKDKTLQFVPTNLHIQRMRVQSSRLPEKAYSVVTFGCPADHVSGFKNGGLRRLLAESRSSPSFICRWSEGKSSAVKNSMARIVDIRVAISHYKNALYRACANASPQDMNDAMIGISKQVQQLLWQMQSSIVSDAIENLIRARPGAIKEELGGEGTLSVPLTKESKRLSMKRRSAYAIEAEEGRGGGGGGGGGRCNCGKCFICVPTPADWLWNGKKFVRVSTREWKQEDSYNSIQKSLVALVESVEEATRKVVDQQHEAVASEVGYTLSTFKPSYVWSQELIPIFHRLCQTMDGLFRVALSSLSFTLVQLDSYVQGLRVLKGRRDVVFSQALTCLVTSFYLVLSQNFLDSTFLRQIREIGFLAQFESLLSSMGDESGMLEDMCVAVAELSTVTFQFAELRGPSGIPFDFHVTGTRDGLTVQFLLAREYLASLPDELLKLGEPISVVPVLFTQGVNERQTLANIKQEIQLQEDINHQGLNTLSSYVEKYIRVLSVVESSQSRLAKVQAHDLLDLLKQQYTSHKSKNIEFLLTVEQLCRRMRGGRLTSCKSGKDRTSMSVTLEECGLLRANHHLHRDTFMRTLSTLRSHGTRLENCYKNTGHRCYNFNQLQLMLLPKLLAPPLFTCKDPD